MYLKFFKVTKKKTSPIKYKYTILFYGNSSVVPAKGKSKDN